MHKCTRCGQTFDRPSKLARHQSRKTDCTKSGGLHVCEICGRSYAHRSSFARHQVACVAASQKAPSTRDPSPPARGQAPPAQAPLGREQASPGQEQAPLEQEQAMAELARQLGQLQAEVKRLAEAPSSSAPVQILYAPNAKTINIRAFGSEDYGWHGKKEVRKILDGALPQQDGNNAAAAAEAFRRLFRALHSDIDQPQNLTCFLSSVDSLSANVHTKQGHWDIIPYEEAAGALSVRTIDHLERNQPTDANAGRYAGLVRTLFENEDAIKQQRDLVAPILYSNKTKLVQTGILALPP